MLRPILPLSLMGAILCTLTACSTSSETFDCKEGKGVGCKSISAVNKMVDQGTLGASEEEIVMPPPVLTMGSLVDESSFSGDMVVDRIKEEHLRVWVAPFQDEQGNLHEGSITHTVLKPGYWHIKEAL